MYRSIKIGITYRLFSSTVISYDEEKKQKYIDKDKLKVHK